MERALRCKVDAGQRMDTSSVSKEDAGQGIDCALRSKEDAGQRMDTSNVSKEDAG